MSGPVSGGGHRSDLAAVRLRIAEYDSVGSKRPLTNKETLALVALIRRDVSLVGFIAKAEAGSAARAAGFARKQYDAKKRRKAAAAANIPPAPKPIDWKAVRAEQAAKPASARWPYTMPALVERVWQTRAPTWVASASSIA